MKCVTGDRDKKKRLKCDYHCSHCFSRAREKERLSLLWYNSVSRIEARWLTHLYLACRKFHGRGRFYFAFHLFFHRCQALHLRRQREMSADPSEINNSKSRVSALQFFFFPPSLELTITRLGLTERKISAKRMRKRETDAFLGNESFWVLFNKERRLPNEREGIFRQLLSISRPILSVEQLAPKCYQKQARKSPVSLASVSVIN